MVFIFSKSPIEMCPLSFMVYLGAEIEVSSDSSNATSLPAGEVAEMSLLPLGLPSCGVAGDGAG